MGNFFLETLNFYKENVFIALLTTITIVLSAVVWFFHFPKKNTTKCQIREINDSLALIPMKDLLDVERNAKVVFVFLQNIFNEKHFACDVYKNIFTKQITYKYRTIVGNEISNESEFEKITREVFGGVKNANYTLLGRNLDYSFVDKGIVQNVKMMTVHMFDETNIQIYFTFEDVNNNTMVFRPQGEFLKTLIEHYNNDEHEKMFEEISKMKDIV